MVFLVPHKDFPHEAVRWLPLSLGGLYHIPILKLVGRIDIFELAVTLQLVRLEYVNARRHKEWFVFDNRSTNVFAVSDSPTKSLYSFWHTAAVLKFRSR